MYLESSKIRNHNLLERQKNHENFMKIVSDKNSAPEDGFFQQIQIGEALLQIGDTKISYHRDDATPVVFFLPNKNEKSLLNSKREETKQLDMQLSEISELRDCIKNVLEVLQEFRAEQKNRIEDNRNSNVPLSKNESLLNRLKQYVEENIEDSTFGVHELMKMMHMSRTQLHRKIKEITGLSTTEFIRSIRLREAAKLLKLNSDYVTQVGYQIGFSDHSYFSKCFKKQFGVSPSVYANS